MTLRWWKPIFKTFTAPCQQSEWDGNKLFIYHQYFLFSTFIDAIKVPFLPSSTHTSARSKKEKFYVSCHVKLFDICQCASLKKLCFSSYFFWVRDFSASHRCHKVIVMIADYEMGIEFDEILKSGNLSS